MTAARIFTVFVQASLGLCVGYVVTVLSRELIKPEQRQRTHRHDA